MSKRVGEEYNRVSLTPLVSSLKKVENTASRARSRRSGLGIFQRMSRFRSACIVVHRLINGRDQSVVVNASGVLDGSSVAFLPNLSNGEVLLIGTNSTMPLPVTIDPSR